MKFKVVPHFPNYEISEDGKTVFDLKRQKNKAIRLDKDGYPRTTLFRYVDGKKIRHDLVLHIISAMTWIVGDWIPKGMQVDHINDDKSNPHKDNLQIITPKENQLKKVKKEAKLTFEDAEEIREICAFGFDRSEVAKAYGISNGHLRNILYNQKWKPEYHKGEC